MARPFLTSSTKTTIIRLATSDDTEREIEAVQKALTAGMNFIYWGNSTAASADYVFVHQKGQTTVSGVLKLWQRQPTSSDLIDDDSFALHRPSGWGTRRLSYARFYLVCEARAVRYPIEQLVNRWNTPLDGRGMHDKAHVNSPLFTPF